MEKEFFDVVREGTFFVHILDAFDMVDNKKVAFVDKNNFYGTTVSLKNISGVNFEFLKTLEVVKNTKFDENQDVLIEILPIFIRKGHAATKYIENSAFSDSIEYVKINEFYYLDNSKRIIKIPYTNTELYESKIFKNTFVHDSTDLNLEDLYNFKKAIAVNQLEPFLSSVEGKHNSFVGYVKRKLYDVKMFDTYFIYPQYGLQTISEYLAMILSFKGVVFCLDKNIKEVKGEEGHAYAVNDAILFGKESVKSIFGEGITFVKMFLCNSKKFNGNFRYVIENTRKEVMHVIGLNSWSKCCSEHKQIMYLIKNTSEVNQEDIDLLHVDDEFIELEINYVHDFDLLEFEKSVNKF